MEKRTSWNFNDRWLKWQIHCSANKKPSFINFQCGICDVEYSMWNMRLIIWSPDSGQCYHVNNECRPLLIPAHFSLLNMVRHLSVYQFPANKLIHYWMSMVLLLSNYLFVDLQVWCILNVTVCKLQLIKNFDVNLLHHFVSFVFGLLDTFFQWFENGCKSR